MNVIAKVLGPWNKYWFSEASAINLAAYRILFFWMLFDRYGGRVETNWQMLKANTSWFPVSFFKLGVPVLDAGSVWWVYKINAVAYLLACLGLFTRTSAFVASLGSLYVFGLAQNYGKYTGGGTDVMVFVICMFALARSGDYLSLDSLVRLWRKRQADQGSQGSLLQAWLRPPSRSGHYQWPVKFGWMMLFILYFTAGISKMSAHAFDWALTDNLRNLLIRHHYSHFPPTDLGLWAADRPWVYKSIGLGSLMAETLCPLGMLHPVPRYLFGLALPGMQFGIYLTLGVKFSAVKLMVLPFLPYEACWLWLSRLGRRLGRSPEPSPAASDSG